MEKEYIKHILQQLSPEYIDLADKRFDDFMEQPEVSARIRTLHEEFAQEVKMLWMDYYISEKAEQEKAMPEPAASKAGNTEAEETPKELEQPASEAPASETTLPEELTKMDEPIIMPGGDNNPFQDNQHDDSREKEESIQGPGKWPAKSKSFVLPNGMVGKPYSTVLEFVPEGNLFVQIDKMKEIGLDYDEATRTLSGTPSLQGEHKIFFAYRITYSTGKFDDYYYVLHFTVNHDPRSLWKNLESNKDDQYWKPDEDKKILLTPELAMVAASKRGRSHAHEGSFRDDDFSLHFKEDIGWHITAVADGAGSAQYSRRGSQIACETAIRFLDETLNAEFTANLEKLAAAYMEDPSNEARKEIGDQLYLSVGTAAFNAQKAIEEEAKEKDAQSKDYSTTLIVSINKKFSFGHFIGAFWVGDGGIGIYHEGKSVKVLGDSDGGEFAGQTRFLTMSETTQPVELFRRLRFDIVDDFTALVLMSDGITDAKFQTDNNLVRIEKWDELWKDITASVKLDRDNKEMDQQLLDWLDFWSPGNHDDRTIAIVF